MPFQSGAPNRPWANGFPSVSPAYAQSHTPQSAQPVLPVDTRSVWQRLRDEVRGVVRLTAEIKETADDFTYWLLNEDASNIVRFLGEIGALVASMTPQGAAVMAINELATNPASRTPGNVALMVMGLVPILSQGARFQLPTNAPLPSAFPPCKMRKTPCGGYDGIYGSDRWVAVS